MKRLAENLVLKTVLGYSAFSAVIIVSAFLLESCSVLAKQTAIDISQVTLVNAFPAITFAWWMSPAAQEDRRTILLRILWMYGPLLVVAEAFVFLVLPYFWRTGSLIGDLVLLTAIFVALAIWHSISSPFARAWMLQKAHDRRSANEAEKRIHWPATFEESTEGEAKISPEHYYGFVSALLAIILIISDALIGEYIDESFGIPGYFGAIVIALVVSVIMYPLHKRTSVLIAAKGEKTNKLVGQSIRSIGEEVTRAVCSGAVSFFRHPKVAALTIVLSSVFGFLLFVLVPKLFRQ